jgi:hypothetical protein
VNSLVSEGHCVMNSDHGFKVEYWDEDYEVAGGHTEVRSVETDGFNGLDGRNSTNLASFRPPMAK